MVYIDRQDRLSSQSILSHVTVVLHEGLIICREFSKFNLNAQSPILAENLSF